ncbi:MAG: phosphoribosylamine--glycine ligase [Spirochaetes bacterium]|nr:phosphoribosylamine--glycine ligase [Spirochaetota bacterium]
MRILILGSGGRESALYLKIKESSHADEVFVWPGNGLIPEKDRVARESVADDFSSLKDFILKEKIDFTVVGNETPLVAGVRDFLKQNIPAHAVFGPNKLGAALEGSKAFSDAFMVEANIPHGTSVVAHSLAEAKQLLPQQSLPLVLKADGLAAGKGVSIHHDYESAAQKLSEIFETRIFGDSGNRVLLQKFLHGQEASLFALCNGRDALLLPAARDYKRALTGDAGENTGGMGAYTPGDHLTDAQKEFTRTHIIEPVLQKFQYRGLLYVGLMIASNRADDLAVVEFNCRFGDPETQSILPILEGDLVEYLLWTDDKYAINFPIVSLGSAKLIPYKRGAVVNVVIAARGYPGAFKKSIPLVFLEQPDGDVHVTGAGIAEHAGKYTSTGGRIANVVAWGANRAAARAKAYAYLENFKTANAANIADLYWREDIGALA